MKPDQLPTRAEVAKLLGCCTETVTALERAGRLDPVMTASGGKRYLLEQVFAIWRRGKPFMGAWRGGKS